MPLLRGILFAIAFAICLWLGEPIDNWVQQGLHDQMVTSYTASNVLKFALAMLLSQIVTWIIPWKKT